MSLVFILVLMMSLSACKKIDPNDDTIYGDRDTIGQDYIDSDYVEDNGTLGQDYNNGSNEQLSYIDSKVLEIFGETHSDLILEEKPITLKETENMVEYPLYDYLLKDSPLTVLIPDGEDYKDKILNNLYEYNFGDYSVDSIFNTESKSDNDQVSYQLVRKVSTDSGASVKVRAIVTLSLGDGIYSEEEFKEEVLNEIDFNNSNPNRNKSNTEKTYGTIQNHFGGSTITGFTDTSHEDKVNDCISTSITQFIGNKHTFTVQVVMYATSQSSGGHYDEEKEISEAELTVMEQFIYSLYGMDNELQIIKSSPEISK